MSTCELLPVIQRGKQLTQGGLPRLGVPFFKYHSQDDNVIPPCTAWQDFADALRAESQNLFEFAYFQIRAELKGLDQATRPRGLLLCTLLPRIVSWFTGQLASKCGDRCGRQMVVLYRITGVPAHEELCSAASVHDAAETADASG